MKKVYDSLDRIITNTNKPFEDDRHIVYANTSNNDESKLGEIMHDIVEKDLEKMKNKVLKKRAMYYKKEKKGVIEVSDEMLMLKVDREKKRKKGGIKRGIQIG